MIESTVEVINVRLYMDRAELEYLRKVAKESFVTIEDIFQSAMDREIFKLKETYELDVL